MIMLQHKQGSPEWIEARIGLPTASRFSEIVTKAGSRSESQEPYMAELLAEWYCGEMSPAAQTAMMGRGSALERKAVAYYELTTGVEATECGLCLEDGRRYGASPDRLIGKPGVLEVKCLSAKNHILALIRSDREDSDHHQQIQGQLLVTAAEWCDRLYYNPTLPSRVVRVFRNEPFIVKLRSELERFADRMEALRRTLRPEVRHDDVPSELEPMFGPR